MPSVAVQYCHALKSGEFEKFDTLVHKVVSAAI